MKHYAVLFHCSDGQRDYRAQFSDLVREAARILAEEYDAGFYLVESEVTAEQLRELLWHEDFDLTEALYVIEVGPSAAGSGSTNMVQALLKVTTQRG